MEVENTSAEPAAADSKECPVCGEEIKAKAIKCRFCNEDLKAFEDAQERELFRGNPAAMYSAGQWCWVVLSLGLMGIYYYLVSRSHYFVITSQRIQHIRGLLNKRQSNLDLFRIDDLTILRPLGMRMLGYSEILLVSSDREIPNARIWGIKDAENLGEDIRSCTINERRRLGILIHTNG